MSASNISLVDLFEKERIHSNMEVRKFLINNYNYLYEWIDHYGDFIIFIWVLSSLFYLIWNDTTYRLTISVLAIVFTLGTMVGNYYLINKIVDKLQSVTDERDDLEEMVNEIMEENDRLKNRLIEYETCIQKYNRTRISSSSDEDFSKLNLDDNDA